MHSTTGRTTTSVARLGALVALAVTTQLISTVVASVDTASRQSIAVAVPERAATATWAEERGALATRLVRGYGLDAPVAKEFAGWILEASIRQRLTPELLSSLVMTESSFRKYARSSVGAIGPAQIRAEMWHTFCGADLKDPEQNVYCGAQILAHLQDVCANNAANDAEGCALRAYNLGYSNRNNAHFADAAERYLTKISRYLDPLSEV